MGLKEISYFLLRMEQGPLKCSHYSEHIFFYKIITKNFRKLWVPFYAIRKAIVGADLLP